MSTRVLATAVLGVAVLLVQFGVEPLLAQPLTGPGTPLPLHPIDHAVIADRHPTIWWGNAAHGADPNVVYDIIVTYDSLIGDVLYDMCFDLPEGDDSTGFYCQWDMTENWVYWWQVRARDNQGSSLWTIMEAFHIDSVPEPPYNHRADFPNDSSGLPLFEMMPTFTWRRALDNDPLDTLRYRLEIATDPDFNSVLVYDSIVNNGTFVDYSISDSLAFGTHYYWRAVACDLDGFEIPSNVQQFWTWAPGDLDHGHSVDIGDLVFLVHYMFDGGPPADPAFVMDINGDCIAPDIADLLYLVRYMFSGGAAPVPGCLNRVGLL